MFFDMYFCENKQRKKTVVFTSKVMEDTVSQHLTMKPQQTT